jgi:hypothetical protein
LDKEGEMAEYEGLVESVTVDEKVQVVIRPGKAGIPGAPELNGKVCHGATDGSIVRTEALNRVGAQVGDWVAVTRPTGLLIKNAAALLGLPMMGGIAGLAVGLWTGGLGAQGVGAAACAAAGIAVGIIVGVSIYRNLSFQNVPVVSRVLRSRAEIASMLGQKGACPSQTREGCDLCNACLR